MTGKALIFDTSVMCCWLKISGKESCGPDEDRWDHARISELVEIEERSGSTFVIPVATIIETGNHIAQSAGDRYDLASVLAEKLRAAAEERAPWAAFEDQSGLWSSRKLIQLCQEWPNLAAQGIGIGNTTIKEVAEFYASTGSISVEILTGDKGLKAYQPAVSPPTPRRRAR